MSLDDTISQVQENLRKGLFPSEAAVSTGAVLPILNALGWQVFNPSVVTPEYTVEGRRVDFALCRSNGQPVVFLEVKRVGVAESGERQLFEYAFHRGVPLAVLTDGQEWNFYLPAGEGDYQDRRVYKLDLLERDLSECSYSLNRYLSYADVSYGVAFENAQSDYRDVNREREIDRILPQAWDALLSEADDLLVEILADKVADLCGYKPDSETCADFLSSIARNARPSVADRRPSPTSSRPTPSQSDSSGQPPAPSIRTRNRGQTWFVLHGQKCQCRNAIEVLTSIFEKLAEADPKFPERFASRKQGYKRLYLSQNKYDLHPDREYCDKNGRQLKFGWFIDTKQSNILKEKIIKMACEVAGLEFGKDLIVNLAGSA